MESKTTKGWLKELIDSWNTKNGDIFAKNLSLLRTYVNVSPIKLNLQHTTIENSFVTLSTKSIEEFVNKQKRYILPTVANTLIENDKNEGNEIGFSSPRPNFSLIETARKIAITIIKHQEDPEIFQLFPLIFQYYITHISDFVKLLKTLDKPDWLYSWLQVFLSELQRISLASDSCGKKHGDFRVAHPISQKYIESITDLYRLALSDTRHGTSGKKLFALLPSVNMLLRLYFRTSNIQLCGPVILSVTRFSSIENFSSSDLNTFNFLAGKKAMFTGDIESAVKLLNETFDACPDKNVANKRLILIYLIPIQMLLGILPLESILNEYSLEPFISLARSIKNGHLKLYHSTMEQYKEFFVKHGIYVVLLKAEFLVLRSLLKYVFTYCESYNISLDTVHNAYNLSYGREVSRSRFESMLSSLIYNGYIQGTILSEHQRLMVSKSKPFPKLSV